MSLSIWVVDAFTARPFAGNPAAVCILPESAPDSWMQQVAREMNLSETAFLVSAERAEGPGWELRWFTPSVEVALCGHATLASAHILWETQQVMGARFFTRESGILTTARRDGALELNFPARPCQEVPPLPALDRALGFSPLWLGKGAYDYLALAPDEGVVRSLDPDQAALSALKVRGVMVTAPGRDYDFVSRFFAPGAGVPEDPVTGSAHCSLAPFWAERLGKNRMRAFQASARGGEVEVELAGDDRVLLRGQAVTVWRGELLWKP